MSIGNAYIEKDNHTITLRNMTCCCDAFYKFLYNEACFQ